MAGVAEPALKKLRNRLLFINMTCLTLVIAVAFSIIYINFYNRAQNEIERQLSSIPRGVLENVMLSSHNTSIRGSGSPQGDISIVVSGEPYISVDYTKSFVANIGSDNGITVFSILDLDNETYAGAIEAAFETGEWVGDVNIANRAWRFSLEQNSGLFAPYDFSIVFLDIEDTNTRLRELAANLLLIGALAIIAILLISLNLANRAIRPVEENMIRQRRFIADASHELKTPIAVIAANAEAASESAAALGAKSEDLSLWIGNISDETNRMNGLIESLLALAKTGEKQADNTQFDLIEAVCEEADRVEAFLFEKGVSFDLDLRTLDGEPLTVRSDRAKVQAVVSVLLENAVKYTPEKGLVTLALGKENGNGVFVSVSNSGVFIPPEHIEHIFDRFFRADPSRNSGTGGHGIGLSIAKEIADTLGGELNAASAPQEGGGAVNTFTLRLPA